VRSIFRMLPASANQVVDGSRVLDQRACTRLATMRDASSVRGAHLLLHPEKSL
jgi:hypothetical protein